MKFKNKERNWLQEAMMAPNYLFVVETLSSHLTLVMFFNIENQRTDSLFKAIDSFRSMALFRFKVTLASFTQFEKHGKTSKNINVLIRCLQKYEDVKKLNNIKYHIDRG